MARFLENPIEGRDYLFCEEFGTRKDRPQGVKIDTLMQRLYCSRKCSNIVQGHEEIANRGKLTADEVRAIRASYPEYTIQRLAARCLAPFRGVDPVKAKLDLRPLVKNLDCIPVADPDDLSLIWLNCKGSGCQKGDGEDYRQRNWIGSVHFEDNATKTG